MTGVEPRPARTRAPSPGRVRAALAAVLALAAALVVAPAVARTSSARAADEAVVDVRIVSIAPQVLEPGEDLRVTVEVTNTTSAPVEDARAVLWLNRFRMGSRDEVAAWADRGLDEPAGQSEISVDLTEPLLPDAARTVTLTLPADQVHLTNLPGLWGARGMAVEVAARGERLGLERTYILWNPTDDQPPRVPVSVVLPFVGPANAPVAAPAPDDLPGKDPSDAPTATEGAAEPTSAAAAAARAADDDLDALTAPGGRLRAMLEAATVDEDVTVVVDPSLLPLAESGSASSQRFAQRLRAAIASHDSYGLPWADPDVAAVQHAGQGALLQVAADRTQAELESSEHLLLWAADAGTPDDATLAAVSGAGAAAILAPPAPTAGASGSSSEVAPDRSSAASGVSSDDASDSVRTFEAGVGPVTTVVPDAVLSRLVVGGTATGDGTSGSTSGSTPASIAQRVLAELAVVSHEEPSPAGVVVATDRLTAPDSAVLGAVTSALGAAPWTRTATLSEVLAEPRDARADRAPARTTDRDELDPAAVTALADAREAARSFSEVLDDPDAFLAGIDDQVLAPLAVAWRAAPRERAELVEQTVEQVLARTTGLSVVETSDLNVIATTSDLRLTVRNELAVPVRARLVVDPRKACLTVGGFETPVLEPGDTSVTVPLEAHANCDVLVEVQLVGPAGQDVAEPIAFSARVSPTIESVGTVVVGILLALGLALGIARTVRRGQSARRGARTVSESTGPVTLPVLGGTPADDESLAEGTGPDDAPAEAHDDARAGEASDEGAAR